MTETGMNANGIKMIGENKEEGLKSWQFYVERKASKICPFCQPEMFMG